MVACETEFVPTADEVFEMISQEEKDKRLLLESFADLAKILDALPARVVRRLLQAAVVIYDAKE